MTRIRSEMSLIEDTPQILLPVMARFEEFVIGHTNLGERILIALLAKGHVLLEGVPGTAKTYAALVMSRLLGLQFGRIQLTPDLLPFDLTGQEIFRPQSGEFVIRKGPVFCQFLLADEINRTSPKTQSALLEAMQERQVTIGDQSYPLPLPFMVFATMNPLEHEGTYPLPEAQLDRFLFKLVVENVSSETDLMRIDSVPEAFEAKQMPDVNQNFLDDLQKLIDQVSISEELRNYRSRLILATRQDERVLAGASDRRSKLVLRAAKARAMLYGRSYVTAEDIREVMPDALRHVLFLDLEAEADGVTTMDVIAGVMNSVASPKEV